MKTTANLFARRALAYFVDGLVMLLVTNLLIAIPTAWFGRISPQAHACLSVVTVVLTAIYYVGAHWRFGRTIGKAIVGLRVIGVRDQKVSLAEAAIRYLPFFIGAAGFAVSDMLGLSLTHVRIRGEEIEVLSIVFAAWVIAEIIVALLNKGSRSIHDIFAHTRVIDPKSA